MTSVNTFPIVPPARSGLTPQDISRYVTSVAYANDALLASATTTLETQVAAIPSVTKAASVPNAAVANSLWIDTSSSNQMNVCIGTYSAGDSGKAAYWSAVADVTAQTAASTALSTGTTPKTSTGSSFPSSFTQGWIWLNDSTGAAYLCKTTYTATTSALDRPSKFISLVDAATSAVAASVKSAVDDMGDDEKITPSEKLVLQREWTQIQNNKSAGDTLATANSLTSNGDYLTMVAAYNALNTYLNTTLTVFADLTTTLDLVTAGSGRSEWNTKWTTWYSTNATFAKTATSALKTDINLTQSDETITQSEAKDYKVQWDYEIQNRANHEVTIDALVTAGLTVKASNATWLTYLSAYNMMNTYLTTTLNLFANTSWPLVLSDEGSSASDWRSKWSTYATAERAMSVLGNTTLSTQIDSFANDGSIDVQEKRTVKAAWGAIHGSTNILGSPEPGSGEYYLLAVRAASLISAGNTSLSTTKTDLDNAYNTLYTYLGNTLSGVGGIFDMDVTTTVDNTDWDSIWNSYYAAYAVLDDATSAIADTSAGLISGLVSDGVVTAGKEKQQLITRYDQIVGEVNALDTKAAIGVGASTVAMHAAFSALENYLFGLFGSEANFLDDKVGSTSVNYAVFTTKFQDYYDAREALETSILALNFANLQKDSAALPSIALDGIVTSEEKYVAKTYWDTIYGTGDNGEHNAVYTQAVALLSAGDVDIITFDDAFTQLWNYLTDNSHGSPTSVPTALDLFTSMGTDLTMDPPQKTYWPIYWTAYYTARDAVQLKIVATLQANLDSKLPKSGGTMTGNINFGGTYKCIGLASGTATGQSVRWDEVSNVLNYAQFCSAISAQYSSLTNKAVLSSGDVFSLESAGDSYAKRHGTLSAIKSAVLSAHENATGTSVHGLGTAANATLATTGALDGNVPKLSPGNTGAFVGALGSGVAVMFNDGTIGALVTPNQVITTTSDGNASSQTIATGFNKAFGTTAGTVLEGSHHGSAASSAHTGLGTAAAANTGDFATASHTHTGLVATTRGTSTASSGSVTVTHGLGSTPTAVIATLKGTSGSAADFIKVESIGATTFIAYTYPDYASFCWVAFA